MRKTPHACLLPSELNLIAEIFQRRVAYYPAPGVEPLFFGAGQDVVVSFDGVGHFERMVSQAEYQRLIGDASAEEKVVGHAVVSASFFKKLSSLPQKRKLDSMQVESNVLPQISNAPVIMDRAFSALSEDKKPQPYNMGHLLAVGARGTEYQLLVLSDFSIKFLVEGKNFEVMVEQEWFMKEDHVKGKPYRLL